MSGAKSDPFDARVLATFLRTDHVHLHPLRPSSAAAQELKGLTRDYTRQVRQQTRLLNQLTAALKGYYPRALEVVDDLKSRWGREFLRAYATPGALASLREGAWARWAREHRLGAERATAVGPAQQPQLRCRSTWCACTRAPGGSLLSNWRSRWRRSSTGRRSRIFRQAAGG
jgi:hypothetical protein